MAKAKSKTLPERLNETIEQLERSNEDLLVRIGEKEDARFSAVVVKNGAEDRLKSQRKAQTQVCDELRTQIIALQDQCHVEIQKRIRLEGYLDRIKETDQASQIVQAANQAKKHSELERVRRDGPPKDDRVFHDIKTSGDIYG